MKSSRPICRTLFLVAAFLALGSCRAADPGASLDEGFLHPPDSAKPHTWWHWMNGNVTREGITADLEAMKRVGVGGAQMFDVTDGILPGPVKYMSDEWRGMVKHAVQEADRLGLELCIHNCAGWSSSGGPWIKPEQAMQMVTTSEVRVKGPARFEGPLPQPAMRVGFYQDIAVLAFPTPPAEVASMATLAVKVTASVPGFDARQLLDDNPDTQSVLTLRTPGKPQYIQLEFPQAFTARSLTLTPGGGRNGNQGELQVSDDGASFKKAADFWLPDANILRASMTVNFEPVTGRFYRVAFPRVGGQPTSVALAELRLESGFRISNFAVKAGYTRVNDPAPEEKVLPAETVVQQTGVLDLTRQLDANGRLTWDVPAGEWTILRLGHTPTGKSNHPAPEEGTGLECDKLSREAAEAHFAGMLAHVISDIGPLAGKGLKHVLIDSYEVDCQNWTPRFREEFQSRRGYDPLTYLPVMTGRVVNSLEQSERFLWDLRRTIADLYTDNYYGYFATMVHRYGLKLSAEPYGNGNFEDLACGGRADIPMGEFWAGWGNDNQCPKLAASAAHTMGKSVVGAESFTADPSQGKWQNHPYDLKPLGDLIYCGGVNRFIFHRYAQQPWLNLVPGMTMGPHGMHFERTITWWNQSPAWLQYLARCQYLLQSGLFAADLCYFTGEGAPNSPPARQGLTPPPPAGYDYDSCDAEVILTRMAVKDGRVVLPDGMSYRVLVLPPGRTMTPAVLRKVRDLVREGATVVGPKPLRSPSLQDYPNCDREVVALADEVWGSCDGQTVTEHACGKGIVYWGKPLPEVLASRHLPPDCEWSSGARKAEIQYIHRTIDGAEAYFVSNQNRRLEAVECTFRVSGRAPELWYPDTGRIERAPVYHEAQGRTAVLLRFDPAGSVFVVFRKPAKVADHPVAVRCDGQSLFDLKPKRLAKLEIRKAVYGVFTAEQSDFADVTAQVEKLVHDGRLVVSADNSIAGDPAPNVVKQMRVDYTLDGKPLALTVEENQTIKIPEQPPAAGEKAPVLEIKRALYGVIPAEPVPPALRQVDVTQQLAALVHDGTLSVAASNALAGDPAQLVVKQLRVDYTLDGQPYSRLFNENQLVDLPDGTESTSVAETFPRPALDLSADGRLTVTAWEPGSFEADTASGKTLRARVAEVAKPVGVEGPWELRFPPNLGAPAAATFDKLISWPESADPGVKYFSGTATYLKDVDLPAGAFGPGKTLWLDLGVVREIAEVRLNGKDLGILWKPPFRVEVSDTARPGRNRLEVGVTNLWPNRLIGDEQLPDDCEWLPGGPMKAWPSWLLEGKPRPPTGRVTFTTWKHYTKDSPLLESGLLGPVRVFTGQRIALGPK